MVPFLMVTVFLPLKLDFVEYWITYPSAFETFFPGHFYRVFLRALQALYAWFAGGELGLLYLSLCSFGSIFCLLNVFFHLCVIQSQRIGGFDQSGCGLGQILCGCILAGQQSVCVCQCLLECSSAFCCVAVQFQTAVDIRHGF